MSEQVVSDRVDRGEHAGRVWLGGDTKSRSIFRVDRMERPEWVLLGVFGAATFAVLLTGHSIVSLVVASGIAAVGWGVTVRVSVPGTSLDSSVALWVRTRVSWVVRGWARIRSGPGGVAPAGVGSLLLTDVETPVGVVGVAEHGGVADGGAAGAYVTAVVEAQGQVWASGEAWDRLLVHLSSESSPVSHVVQTARIMAWDSTDHVSWVAPMASSSPSAELVDSYAQIVDDLGRIASAQRTWVTLRIPAEALVVPGRKVDTVAAAGRVVANVVERADGLGIAMRPLSVVGRGALARHMMDPSFSPDDYVGVGDAWEGVWPSWRATDDGWCVDVDSPLGVWRESMWEVPASRIVPGWLSRDWLYRALRDVEDVPVRTFVVAAEVQSRAQAVKAAREDLTSDLAALRKTEGVVSTGEEDAQAGSSAIRVRDLSPESGAGGVRWSMAVGLHATPETWDDAARHMTSALEDCSISAPARLRFRQDQVLPWMLGVGLAWKKGR